VVKMFLVAAYPRQPINLINTLTANPIRSNVDTTVSSGG